MNESGPVPRHACKLTLELEKRTGESKRTEGLKLGGKARKEEGESGGGEIGREAGGKDLNLGRN